LLQPLPGWPHGVRLPVIPLHLSDMGRAFGGRPGDCPVTENVSDRLMRLPFHNAFTGSEQELVMEAILDFKIS